MTTDLKSIQAVDERKPRRKRRLLRFALWVSGSLVLLWIAAFLHATWSLNQAIAELKRRGEPTTFAEAVARNQSSASVPNGADLLREALTEDVRLGHPGNSASAIQSASSQPITDRDAIAVKTFLTKGEKIVELVDRAVALPPGPFTLHADLARMNHPYWFDPVQDLRSLARLLWVDVRFSAGRGDSRRTFRRLKSLYLLSEQLSREAFVVPQLIRIAIIGLANGSSWTALPLVDFTPEELAELASLAARIDRHFSVTPALVNERALEATIFQNRESLEDELRSSARSKFRTGTTASEVWIFLEYRWIDLITSPLGLPARRRAAAQTLSIPNDVLELADTPPPWSQEQTQSFNAWKEALNIDRVSLNAGEGGAASALTYATRRLHRQLAMTQLAFRLRRFDRIHGKLPDRLEELCNMSMPELPTKWFEGKPFIYTKKDRSFTLKADPSIIPEWPPANNQHRETLGLLFQFDADAAKSQPSPSK
jgi:hypothetical protein